MSLNQMSKAVLQAKLRIHGEEPPEKWTVVELRARLAEVEPSLLEPSTTSSNRTELQNWVHRINKARVKKANLISLCQEEMGIEVSGTETIPVLERKALLRAHSLATPMARDLVGFGKHAGYQPLPEVLPGVDPENRFRGEWVRLPVAPTGAVAAREPRGRRGDRGTTQAQADQEEGSKQFGQQRADAQLGHQQCGCELIGRTRDSGQGYGRHPPEFDGSYAEPPGEGDRPGGGTRAAAQEGQQQGDVDNGQLGDYIRRLPEDQGQDVRSSEFDYQDHQDYEAQSTQLSAGRASQLEHQSWEIVPSLFQSLVGYDRLVLLEIGGEPNSYLTTAVQDLVGHTGAAKRLSVWNGADLSSPEGVKFVLQQILQRQPGLVWLAPSDTPFSPLQHANMRSDAQKEELKQKRAQAQKCFVGAAIVYRFCVQHGIHCVWSMSEKSDAWRLPVLQKLQQHGSNKLAVTHGCQVDLRSSDGDKLMKKGWKLITTHARLAQVMDRRCMCAKDYVHGRCEGQGVSRNLDYTEQYARRAAEAITMELNHVDVGREC